MRRHSCRYRHGAGPDKAPHAHDRMMTRLTSKARTLATLGGESGMWNVGVLLDAIGRSASWPDAVDML